tara:strand:+ start:1266 stop:1625 length:360 start_codon:yes stop_codon:yes gene_type:complete
MFSPNDYENVKNYLEDIGIKRTGWAVENPIQSLFKYRSSTHDTMISFYISDNNNLMINYIHGRIIREEPIDSITGKGIFETDCIIRCVIESWEHLRTILQEYNGELFREQNINLILDEM